MDCQVPVIAAIQGAAIGGALDLISACDIRYCTENSKFSIKEVDIGLAADIGTLQRLKYIVNDNTLRELAFTARNFLATEAKEIGLINRVFKDKDDLMKNTIE